MKRTHATLLLTLIISGSAFAHSGVKNAAVKARMDAMSSIAAEMKILGQMAKGKTVFDQSRARAAAATISKHAANTPTLFEAQETDPKSEAKAEIWINFDDFVARSEDLKDIAIGLSNSITNETELDTALTKLANSCKACHKAYRE